MRNRFVSVRFCASLVALIGLTLLFATACAPGNAMPSPTTAPTSSPSPSPTTAPTSSPTPTKAPPDDASISLRAAVRQWDRDAVAAWGASHTLAEVNRSVHSLSDEERHALCRVVLDTNATDSDKDSLLDTLDGILGHPDLGFYAEILSYTPVTFGGDGFYFTRESVLLNRDAYFGEEAISRRNLLMHEVFHSFNQHNGVVIGAMNEGASVWVRKRPFLEEYLPGEGWTEAVFGTMNYYRDIMRSSTDLQAPASYTRKLYDVYRWLGEGDPSHLPWWDDGLLKTMYSKYFEGIDRDVDFYSVWLPAFAEAEERMQADPLMKDATPDRAPTGTP